MAGSRLLPVLLLLLCSLGGAGAAFALTDAEYKRYSQESPDFAQAEKRLNKVWKNLKELLPKAEFSLLLQEQRAWISQGRDQEARAVPGSSSPAAAYAQATAKRAAELEARLAAVRGAATAGPAGTGTQSADGKGGRATGAAQAPTPSTHAAQASPSIPGSGGSLAGVPVGQAGRQAAVGQAPVQTVGQASAQAGSHPEGQAGSRADGQAGGRADGRAGGRADGQSAASAPTAASGQTASAAPLVSVSEGTSAGGAPQGGGTILETPGLTPLPFGAQTGGANFQEAGPGASASPVGGDFPGHASPLPADNGASSAMPSSSVAAGVVSLQGSPSAFPAPAPASAPPSGAGGAAASAFSPAPAVVAGSAPEPASGSGGNALADVGALAEGLYVREGGRISLRKDPRGYFLTVAGDDSDGRWTCGVDGVFALQGGMLIMLNEMEGTAPVRIEVGRDRLVIREHLTEFCGMNGSLAGEYIRK